MHKRFVILLLFPIVLASCAGDAPPTRMVEIPGGRFVVGGLPDEKKLHPPGEMELPGFYMEIYEVTIAQYATCVKAKECPDRSGEIPKAFGGPRQPVIMVTQSDAAAYCTFVGRRLPTEWEWERAARGPKAYTYPYGNDFLPGAANTSYAPLKKCGGTYYRFTAPVGVFDEDRSPFGVFDMGGNVAEWTTSRVGAGEAVVRGGHWYSEKEQSASYYREFVPTGDLTSYTIGFRCVKSAN